MRLLSNGLVQLEDGELPQLRNNRIGTSVEDVINKGAAFFTTEKTRGKSNTYVAKLEPVDIDNKIYQVIAKDPLESYAMSSMAGTLQGALNNNNAANRFAASIIEEGLMEQAGYPVDRKAAAISYGKKSALGYETHHLNEIDTQMKILASLGPEAQERYVDNLIARGYRLSDDPRNQIRAYGSPKNVPGYRDSSGKRMIPDQHIGYSQHANIHAAMRKLAAEYNLPDSRIEKGNNSIQERMAGLPTEQQRIDMGMALTEIGRLAAMQELAMPGTERYPQRQNAELKQRKRVEERVLDTFLPIAPEDKAQQYSIDYMKKLLRK